ncbi:MAG: hypothetical protein U5P10_14405 [Spirochaetia bacterium]|nr:hypothetical protein [Spirochaetia bacterium]
MDYPPPRPQFRYKPWSRFQPKIRPKPRSWIQPRGRQRACRQASPQPRPQTARPHRSGGTRRYIAAECAPINLARFDLHFGGGNPTEVIDSVKDALKAYQNPDGGFGRGLEPDFLLPDSSPMATTIAFQIIEELEGRALGEAVGFETVDSEAPSACNPMITKAVHYLEQSYVDERDGWYAVGPAINDHPHAP